VPVALATLAHALALPVFYLGYAENPLDVRGVSPRLSGEGIADNRGSKDMDERHAAWMQRLPEDHGALWDWLIALDPVSLADLLAYCAAATVKPERGTHVDRVAAAAGLDLAQWWTPTAKGVESADRRSRHRRRRGASCGGYREPQEGRDGGTRRGVAGQYRLAPCPAPRLTAAVPASAHRRGGTSRTETTSVGLPGPAGRNASIFASFFVIFVDWN